MAVAVAMEVAVAVAMAMAMAKAGAMVAVKKTNLRRCKNDLDDSWIYFSSAFYGLPVAGSALRLLSLRAG